MTAEQLVDMSLEQLQAMSPADIEAHFSQYLQVTRPENHIRSSPHKSSDTIGGGGSSTKRTKRQSLDTLEAQAKALLARYAKADAADEKISQSVAAVKQPNSKQPMFEIISD